MLRKHLHFILIFSNVLILTVLLGGCVKEVSVGELPRPNSLVRFINTAKDTSVTITVYGRDSVTAVMNTTLSFATASPYVVIPSGNRKVLVQSAGVNNTEILLTLNPDVQYSVGIWTVKSPTMNPLYERFTYNDEAYIIDTGKGTKGAIKFLNCMSDGSAISIKLDSAKGTSVVASIAARAYNGYIKYAAGKSYVFSITDATSTELAKITVPVTGNTRYTVAAFGKATAASAKLFTDDK
jgi:hypothetical protein